MKQLQLVISMIMIAISLLVVPLSAFAQDEQELVLSLSRDFGYSSGTGDIQGTFSMRIREPGNLTKVDFQIDGITIYEDSEPPFQYQFNTDNYSPGLHEISAVGYAQNGSLIQSQVIRANFVTAEAGSRAVFNVIVPLFAVVFGLMALSYLLPAFFRKGKTIPLGTQRNYGFIGGTICKKCHRPFAFNFMAMNILVGKLDRCPHCGKWGIYHRQPLEILRTAEIAELADIDHEPKFTAEISDEEKVMKDLDESRFQDL